MTGAADEVRHAGGEVLIPHCRRGRPEGQVIGLSSIYVIDLFSVKLVDRRSLREAAESTGCLLTAHGIFDDAAHKSSFEAALARHPATVASAVACGVGAAVAAKVALGRRRAGRCESSRDPLGS
ncbi:hypothetical protein [Streptomyces sp. NPDC055400]